MNDRRRGRSSAVRYEPHDGREGATVTVVIPCFNYARFLPQAVDSVLTQEGVTVDVIVVDDASTDESVSVAERLAAADPRVRVVKNERNRGAVETFNRGLADARGEFLVRLDADDMLTPGSLRRAAAVMQRLPGVGLVYGHPIHFEGDALPAPRIVARSWTVWSGRDWLQARCVDGSNVITSPEVLMRRSVIDVVGGQRPLAHTHDMEMWLRIAAHSDIAYIVGADQAWHRDHADSLSTKAEHPLLILTEVRDAFDVLFDGLGADYEGADELRARAHRAIALEALAHASRDLDRGRSSGDVDKLLRFADETDATIGETALRRRLERRTRSDRGLPSFVIAATGIFPRLRRRMRQRVRDRRWSATGVYEPLTIRSAAAGDEGYSR
ncbi:MAG TPA: glycosyltransferase family 2 protein [Microbacterium sp.]|uniref:glycosyltransferase family 2 protein n=1 Tax=Microbacterium sp. TaxID=51671 RepID=UPI002C704F3E|nr:glycosyltransferase family 2 protein [Microbacterium sp.]HWI31343.1 glycosyltransferase family 2 protein [Microbacterium sp.]